MDSDDETEREVRIMLDGNDLGADEREDSRLYHLLS